MLWLFWTFGFDFLVLCWAWAWIWGISEECFIRCKCCQVLLKHQWSKLVVLNIIRVMHLMFAMLLKPTAFWIDIPLNFGLWSWDECTHNTISTLISFIVAIPSFIILTITVILNGNFTVICTVHQIEGVPKNCGYSFLLKKKQVSQLRRCLKGSQKRKIIRI